MEQYVLQLATADPTLAGQLLKRSGLANAVHAFGDPDFLCEPYMWLHRFASEQPDRSVVEDDDGVPGRWSLAFIAAVDAMFGSIGSSEERALLRRHFEALSREYFVQAAIPGSIPAFLRRVEPTVCEARVILDTWTSRRLVPVAGKQAADEYTRHAAAGRLALSKRDASIVASALRVKNPTGSTGSTSSSPLPFVKLVKKEDAPAPTPGVEPPMAGPARVSPLSAEASPGLQRQNPHRRKKGHAGSPPRRSAGKPPLREKFSPPKKKGRAPRRK